MKISLLFFIALHISVAGFGKVFHATAAPPDTIKYSGNPVICPGGSILLTANPAPGGATYVWKLNGNVIGNGPSITANQPGAYTVKVDTVNYDTVVIKLSSNPVADFTPPTDVCSGSAAPFTSTVSGGTAPYKYSWVFGDNGTATTQNPNHTFTSLGCGTQSFSNSLVVTDANGCKGSVSKAVVIKQAPDVQVTDPDNPGRPFNNCNNDPSVANPNYTITVNNISPSSACINNYSIDWGDGQVENNISFPINHTYLRLGQFNLKVTALSTNGCSNTKTYTVANQKNPDIGIATFGPTEGCADLPVNIVLSSWVTNSPGTTYLLEFGDGTFSSYTHPINQALTNDTIVHTYTTTSCPNSESYNIRITATNACRSKGFSGGQIVVKIPPKSNFTIPDSSFCVGVNVCFNNVTKSGYVENCIDYASRLWNFGDPESAGNNTSNLKDPCHIYNKPGVYTVTLTTANNNNLCGVSVMTHTVCITAPPTPSFTLNNTTNCSPLPVTVTNTTTSVNNCVPLQYFWTVGYQQAFCGTTPDFIYTNGTSDTSANPSFLFRNPGTYTITLAVTNACGTFRVSKTIDVKKPPVVTLSPLTNGCNPVAVNPSATISSCGTSALQYAWTFQGGSPATSTILNPGQVTFNTVGPHTISLSVTNECGTTTESQQITVKPVPDLIIPSSIVVCAGEVVSSQSFSSGLGGTTIRWTNSNTSIGLNTGENDNNTPSFIATNNSLSPVTATIIVTATNDGCSKQSSFTITVNPKPQKPAVVRPVVYCLNSTTVPLNATADAGDTLKWYSSLPLINGTTIAPTPSSSTQGTVKYFVTQTNMYNCVSDTAIIPVNVFNDITGNTIKDDQTICTGTSISALTSQGSVAGGDGNFLYQWQSSVNNGVSWINTGSNQPDLAPSNVNVTTKFRRVVSSGACADTSNIITITVLGSLTNFDISVAQTICYQTSPQILTGQLPVGGSGTFVYEWESSALSVGQWVSIANSNTQNYQPPALSANTYYRRKVTSGACSAYSSNVLITVNPNPVLDQNPDHTYCNASTVNDILFTGSPSSGVTYAWANDNVLIGLGASGSGSLPSFVAANSSSPKIPFTANITVTPTYTGGGVGCVGNTMSFKINVLPSINVNAIPNDTVCTGTTMPSLVPASDAGVFNGSAVSYKWSVSGAGIDLANGAGVQIPSYTTINNSNADMQATITITPVYSFNGKDCDGVPVNYTITVKPVNKANAGADVVLCAADNYTMKAVIINGLPGMWSQLGTPAAVIQDPSSPTSSITGLLPGNIYKFIWKVTGFTKCAEAIDTIVIDNKTDIVNKIDTVTKTICEGVSIIIKDQNTSGGTGIYLYQWQQSTDGINFTDIANATNKDLNFTPSSSVFVRRKVSSLPCENFSDTAHVIVTPGPTTAIAGIDQTLCAATVTTLNGNQPLIGTGFWSVKSGPNNPVIVSPGNASTSVPGLVPGDYTFSWTISNGVCPPSSDDIIVSIKPALVNKIDTATQTICASQSVSVNEKNTSGGTGNYLYQWQQSTDGINFTDIANATNKNLIFIPSSSVFIRRKVSSLPCENFSDTAHIIVQAAISNNQIFSDTSICINTAASLLRSSLATGGDGQFNYTWESSIDNGVSWQIIAGATGQDYVPGVLVQTTKYRRTISTNLCSGPQSNKSNIITVTVNLNASAAFSPSDTVGCVPYLLNNAKLNVQAYPLLNSQYLWYVNDSLISSGLLFSGYTLNNTDDTITLKLKTISRFGCLSDSVSHLFITRERPVPSFTLSTTEGCGPLTVDITNTTPSAGRYNYQWNLGNGQTSNTIQPGSFVYQPSAVYGDTTYTITMTTITLCDTIVVKKNIVVHSLPKALFAPASTVGCSPFKLSVNNTSKGIGNIYYWDFGDGKTDTTFANGKLTHTYNSGNIDTFNLRLIALNGCGRDTSSINIVVSPNVIQSQVSVNGDEVYGCAPHNVNFINTSSGASLLYFDYGDNTPVESVPNSQAVISHTYLSGGIDTVKIRLVNDCTDTMIVRYVTTYAMPVAKFTINDTLICTGNSVTTTNTSQNANAYEWLWGDNTSTSSFNATHTYNAGGVYTVRLVAKKVGNFGIACTDTSDAIMVNVVDRIPAVININSPALCIDKSINVSAQDASNAALVDWYFYDNTATPNVVHVTGQRASYIYNSAGTDSVKLVLQNLAGCKDSATKTFVIHKAPSVTNTPFTLKTCNTDTTLSLNATISYDGTDPVTYQWYINDELSGVSNPFIHDFQVPGGVTAINNFDIKVLVQNSFGCGDTAAFANFVVQTLAPQRIQVLPSLVQEQPHYTFAFKDSSEALPNTTYSWDPGGRNQQQLTGREINYTYGDTGMYKVNLWVTDYETGCVAKDSVVVTVLAVPGYLYVPNAFCPGCQKGELRNFLPLGRGLKDYHLSIFNIYGQKIFETTHLNSNGSPDVPWDGNWTTNKLNAQQDAYSWHIEAHFINGTEWKGMNNNKSGFITIIR